eukprot:549593-Pelagomonas_calceolata.AAC.1
MKIKAKFEWHPYVPLDVHLPLVIEHSTSCLPTFAAQLLVSDELSLDYRTTTCSNLSFTMTTPDTHSLVVATVTDPGCFEGNDTRKQIHQRFASTTEAHRFKARQDVPSPSSRISKSIG